MCAQGRGILRNVECESCQVVIPVKFDVDLFLWNELKGKVRNESMWNVTEMNIC